ncbi:hypothetical protein PR202_gb01961 [Eleusine coracana subsp. coracana]|uniref:beta-galactosidase n=1 Tax=Eleusine coracana subsp. coracana TaxID=191504 RepID=A0AAV5DY22_ELECO|nr:hypothetical protein PR202_gb01961 [Eleusine coracana subsp. coracana]
MATRGTFKNLPLSVALCLALLSAVGGEASRRFWIENDTFLKDGTPFQIVGGDVHYFRIVPEYWKDRLLRAKALGLNTIQTYVPWNLHEPDPERWEFMGFADIESYLRLAQELEMLVMLRVGPYICGEWDLGGFPPWLLSIEPALKLRSSDSTYLSLIENEFGSFGDDKKYLHYLVELARRYLGTDTILYTTDGGANGNLKNGSIPQDNVFAGLLILFVLEIVQMAHGGTNFGFYNGANTGQTESDYKADLTSYDYASIAPNNLTYMTERRCSFLARLAVLGNQYMLVENMGRVNYGPYIFDRKGILSPVQIDGSALHHWKMYPLPFNAVDNLPKLQLISQLPEVRASKASIHGDPKKKLQELPFYANVALMVMSYFVDVSVLAFYMDVISNQYFVKHLDHSVLSMSLHRSSELETTLLCGAKATAGERLEKLDGGGRGRGPEFKIRSIEANARRRSNRY